MNNGKKHKIIKTLLSLTISFLIIFIVAMFARAASNTILPPNNKFSVLINDYLDMMMQMVDKAAINLNIKRNTVSEYQVSLISQSISDYVGYSMYQTADIVKNYNPNKNYSKNELEKYKNDYYKMTVENPYLRGMTVFGTDGKMRLNLYLAKNKSWPLELNDNLIKEIIKSGSLVLNATNENTFYIMEYIKNNFGEIIVATRNDYSYVSDIAMYYQVADKRLYISDSRNLIYNVRESVGDNTIEKVSSVINRFAYYKKQPSFVVNDSLSVSMIGKEYPNYFELIVLALTALLILFFQLILNGIIYFFEYLMQIKKNKDYMNSLQNAENDEEELFGDIDENIINPELPKSNAIEDMPPIVEKVSYKIPEEYKETNKEKFNIKKEILNMVSNIKNDFKKKESKVENEIISEEKIENEKEENNIEMLIQNEDIEDNFNNINLINNISLVQEDELNEIIEDINDLKIESEELNEENIDSINTIDNIIEESLTEEIDNIDIIEGKTINSILNKEENSEELINENKKEENEIKETDIKIDEETLENVNKDILDSYNNVLTNPTNTNNEEKSNKDKNNSEDVFAAFDKMLASIISKAEEDAKTIIKK